AAGQQQQEEGFVPLPFGLVCFGVIWGHFRQSHVTSGNGRRPGTDETRTRRRSRRVRGGVFTRRPHPLSLTRPGCPRPPAAATPPRTRFRPSGRCPRGWTLVRRGAHPPRPRAGP